MKNADFFYRQYDKIEWENQKETGLNKGIYHHIIKEIFDKTSSDHLRIYDIGFGVGLFFTMIQDELEGYDLELAGCEPSEKNFNAFTNDNVEVQNKAFQDISPQQTYDFVTANYVMPEFIPEDLDNVVRNVKEMLDSDGEFIMTTANEEYLKNKLDDREDLVIETDTIEFDNESYEEKLYYAQIPEIGTVIDYFREERFYNDLFTKHGFELVEKEVIEDSGFVCTLFRFRLEQN